MAALRLVLPDRPGARRSAGWDRIGVWMNQYDMENIQSNQSIVCRLESRRAWVGCSWLSVEYGCR